MWTHLAIFSRQCGSSENSCDKIAQPDGLALLAIRSNKRRKSRERAHLANVGEFNRRYLTCQISAILYADLGDRRIRSPSVSLAFRNSNNSKKQTNKQTNKQKKETHIFLFNRSTCASTPAQLQNNTNACWLNYYLPDILSIVAGENLRAAFHKYRPSGGTSQKIDFVHILLIGSP